MSLSLRQQAGSLQPTPGRAQTGQRLQTMSVSFSSGLELTQVSELHKARVLAPCNFQSDKRALRLKAGHGEAIELSLQPIRTMQAAWQPRRVPRRAGGKSGRTRLP